MDVFVMEILFLQTCSADYCGEEGQSVVAGTGDG